MSAVARIAVRDDGLCAAAGCRNVRPEAAVRMGDPFCSRQCAADTFAALPPVKAAAVNGSRRQPSVGPSERVTLAHVAYGRQTAPEIAWARDCNVTAVSMHLKSLLDKQLIVRVARGVYTLAELPPDSGREPPAEESANVYRPDSAAAASTDKQPSRPEQTDDDSFPDETKDAYATALIAGMRAFADTREQELALL